MKLSFSLSSKPSSKQNRKSSQNFDSSEDQHDTDAKNTQEFVTEFDASKTLTNSQTKKFIIPPKENEWKPYKKMKNLELPLQSEARDLRFEVESSSVAETLDSGMSYGLNLRQKSAANKGDAHAGAAAGNDESQSNGGGGGGEGLRSGSIENVMLQKLKEDLERLPEDRGLEEFNDMPVEGFGAALLAGYGWYEGRGIGKNTKGDVKVVQYEKRTAKEGLGFVAEMHSHANKDKERDNAKKKEKERNNNEEGTFCAGKDVRVVGGRNAGLKGRIVEILGGDLLVLKLSRSGEEVELRIRDVAELGSKEEDRCLRNLKELKIPGSKDEKKSSYRESKDEKSEEKKRGRDEGRRRRGQREEEMRNQVSWLTNHIRVRIVSKDLKGGRLYLKKGEVVDVVGPTTCDISMDESREVIQGVEQELLETALPRRGGPVLVLYGKHKGAYGNLVERDMEKETGVVRDADSHALFNVRLQQVAEYMGDPSSIGY